MSEIKVDESMVVLPEAEEWHKDINGKGIYTDALGGIDGGANTGLRQLTDRTAYLRYLMLIKDGGFINNIEVTKIVQASMQNVASYGQIVYDTVAECATGWSLWNAADIEGLLIKDYEEFVNSNSVLCVDKTETTFTLKGHGGHFLRPHSQYLNAGDTHEDAIRNITGQMDSGSGSYTGYLAKFKSWSGALTGHNMAASDIKATAFAGNYGQNRSRGIKFDASLQVPTADENRPKAIALYVKIYLGRKVDLFSDIQNLSKFGQFKIVDLEYEEDGWEEWLKEGSDFKKISDYKDLIKLYTNGAFTLDIIENYSVAKGTFSFKGNGGGYGNYNTEIESKSTVKGLWKARDFKQVDGVKQYEMNKLEIYDSDGLVYESELSSDVYNFTGPVTVNGATYTRYALVDDLSAFGARGYKYQKVWDEAVEVKTKKVIIYTGVNL